MKFLIVEPSPLPILIPLGPKYSPQDPVFNAIGQKLCLKVYKSIDIDFLNYIGYLLVKLEFSHISAMLMTSDS